MMIRSERESQLVAATRANTSAAATAILPNLELIHRFSGGLLGTHISRGAHRDLKPVGQLTGARLLPVNGS